MNHISKIVNDELGMQMKDFCKRILNVAYPNFQHRSRKGKIHIKDYLVISQVTGKSLDELITQDPRYQGDLERAQDIANNFEELSAKEPEPEPKPSAPKKQEGFNFIRV